jgi:Arc/MetJ-type ribon-helix-helix transcriptional regulator
MQNDDQTNSPGDVSLERKSDPHQRGDDETAYRNALDDFKSSVKDFAQRIPGSIGRAFESIQARVHAITVQVDEDTQKKIDNLVEAGIFKNRSESAAYLIHEGIKSRSEIFQTIDAKIAEIERLRADMQRIISDPTRDEDAPE